MTICNMQEAARSCLQPKKNVISGPEIEDTSYECTTRTGTPKVAASSSSSPRCMKKGEMHLYSF